MTDLDPELALMHGTALLLAAANVGTYLGLEPGPYPDGQDPIICLGGLPPAPRRAVAVQVYDEVPVDWSTTRYFLQVRLRLSASALDRSPIGQVRDALHDLRHPSMPAGIRVTHMGLVSRAFLGLSAGAAEHSMNFTALCPRARAFAG